MEKNNELKNLKIRFIKEFLKNCNDDELDIVFKSCVCVNKEENHIIDNDIIDIEYIIDKKIKEIFKSLDISNKNKGIISFVNKEDNLK